MIKQPTTGDIVAGLTVALVAIPQSLAYAELAGLPARHGPYASALPSILAALFVGCWIVGYIGLERFHDEMIYSALGMFAVSVSAWIVDMIEEGWATSWVPSLTFCIISLSLPSWLDP